MKTCLRYNPAVSSAVTSSRHGIKTAALVQSWCHDIWRTYSFFLISHMTHRRSHFLLLSHMTRPFTWESSFLSHVTHRPMTHVDSCWLIVTHRCFTLLFIAFPIVLWLIRGPYCSCYLLFLWHSLSFGNVYCSLWRPLFLWHHCSCDTIVPVTPLFPLYYKVRPSK